MSHSRKPATRAPRPAGSARTPKTQAPASAPRSRVQKTSATTAPKGMPTPKRPPKRPQRQRLSPSGVALAIIVTLAVVVGLVWILVIRGQSDDAATAASDATASTTTPAADDATTAAADDATTEADQPTTEAGTFYYQEVSVAEDAVEFGLPDAPVTVDLYQDYMCPSCGQFEVLNVDSLRDLLDQGTLKLRLHVYNFLDAASEGTNYSTRAANAFLTVAQQAPEAAFAFNQALYENQPAEGTEGLSDEEIADLATAQGVPEAVVATFTDLTNEQYIADTMTRDYEGLGITTTPTVYLDGEPYEGNIYSAGVLGEAIELAAEAKATAEASAGAE